MVSCFIEYIIDANKIEEFERYAKMWIPLVNRFGGQHQGYFLPSEGASNKALAIFTFPSLAAYEVYRNASKQDADCIAAFDYATQTHCIKHYQRNFFRPVFN